MFSSDSLIQYVFANEDDTFYCDGLLKLDLDQFIWMKLHEKEKYNTVYFLRESDSKLIVSDLGDKYAEKFTYEHGFLSGLFGGNSSKQFCSWFLDSLYSSSDSPKTAFVCPIEDFCRIFDEKQWNEDLKKEVSKVKRTLRGTIILKVSPQVERSFNLLMNSDVFNILKDNQLLDLRRNNVDNFYQTLKRKKGDSCVFLNTFTVRRIMALLQHIVFRNNEASDFEYPNQDFYKIASEYLVQYLNNRKFHWNEKLFEQNEDLQSMTYRKLYDFLSTKRNWDRFKEKVQIVIKSDNNVEYYLYRNKIEYLSEDSTDVRIFYSSDNVLEKCFLLNPVHDSFSADDALDDDDQMVWDIFSRVKDVPCGPLNIMVYDYLNTFYSLLTDKIIKKDGLSFNRLLYAIRFGIENLYYIPEDKELTEQFSKFFEWIDNCIKISEETFKACRDCQKYEENNISVPDELLTNKIVNKKYLKLADDALRKLETNIRVRNLNNFKEIIAQYYQQISEEPSEPEKMNNDSAVSIEENITEQESCGKYIPEEDKDALLNFDGATLPPEYQ